MGLLALSSASTTCTLRGLTNSAQKALGASSLLCLVSVPGATLRRHALSRSLLLVPLHPSHHQVLPSLLLETSELGTCTAPS